MLDQAILAEFILDGHFGHHVRRMRQTYAERMGALAEAASRRLGGLLDVVPAASGMRAIGWLNTGEKDVGLAERARAGPGTRRPFRVHTAPLSARPIQLIDARIVD